MPLDLSTLNKYNLIKTHLIYMLKTSETKMCTDSEVRINAPVYNHMIYCAHFVVIRVPVQGSDRNRDKKGNNNKIPVFIKFRQHSAPRSHSGKRFDLRKIYLHVYSSSASGDGAPPSS